jgi:hypothetical protein
MPQEYIHKSKSTHVEKHKIVQRCSWNPDSKSQHLTPIVAGDQGISGKTGKQYLYNLIVSIPQ